MKNYDAILSDSLSRIKTPKPEPRDTLLANEPWQGYVKDLESRPICSFRGMTLESSCGTVLLNVVGFSHFTKHSDNFAEIGGEICECFVCCCSCLRRYNLPRNSIFDPKSAMLFIAKTFDKTKVQPVEIMNQLLRFRLSEAKLVALVSAESEEEDQIRSDKTLRSILSGQVS